MILSILIPTLPERWVGLLILTNKILEQSSSTLEAKHEGRNIEILTDSRSNTATTGHKRNLLINIAKGDYIVFIDDDDDISDTYINDIYDAMLNMPDVITFNGWMTTDGKDPVDFEIRLNHPYINDPRDGKDYYLRFPNHLCPMKRELVKDFKFPDVTMGEDYAWAKQIHDSDVLKTEFVIEKKLYHYKYSSVK